MQNLTALSGFQLLFLILTIAGRQLAKRGSVPNGKLKIAKHPVSQIGNRLVKNRGSLSSLALGSQENPSLRVAKRILVSCKKSD